MDWWPLEVLLDKFVGRLTHSVKPEVLPLMEISGVKQARARALYDGGNFLQSNAALKDSRE
jgi:POLQ-like helicase